LPQFRYFQEGFKKKAALRFPKNGHPANRCMYLYALKYRRGIFSSFLILADSCATENDYAADETV